MPNKKWSLPFVCFTLFTACTLVENNQGSCYLIKDNQVFLRYYGGYPRAKEIFLKIEEADVNSFSFIEGSREKTCQMGHIFAKDNDHVFYRNKIIVSANPKTFSVLRYGYSKDDRNVYYKNLLIENVDLNSFYVLVNKRDHAFAADINGLIKGNKRLDDHFDANSFKILPFPYFKDKNHVYFDGRLEIIEGADPASFTCPLYNNKGTYLHYAYDNKNAYYYENGRLKSITGIDFTTFKVLNSHYAKDKNRVYYKYNVIEEADAASFYIPIKHKRRIGKDKKHRYSMGKIDPYYQGTKD